MALKWVDRKSGKPAPKLHAENCTGRDADRPQLPCGACFGVGKWEWIDEPGDRPVDDPGDAPAALVRQTRKRLERIYPRQRSGDPKHYPGVQAWLEGQLSQYHAMQPHTMQLHTMERARSGRPMANDVWRQTVPSLARTLMRIHLREIANDYPASAD